MTGHVVFEYAANGQRFQARSDGSTWAVGDDGDLTPVMTRRDAHRAVAGSTAYLTDGDVSWLRRHGWVEP